MIQNDEEKEWMLPLLELRNALDFRSGNPISEDNEGSDRHLRDFRRMSGEVQLMANGRNIPGPYTQQARANWLAKLLAAQTYIRRNGPADVRNLQLIGLEEPQEIRRIWVMDKHELEDSLPRIYQESTGETYPGRPLDDNLVLGDYTVAASNPASFSGGTGTGAAATITYGVSGIVVTEKGSGYSTPADAGITFSSGAAAATSVLTTENGIPYSAGNQENAITIYANTDDNGSKIGDIIRQRSTRRFKVKTADGTAICTLKSSAVSAEGEMTITATDSVGGTYFVTKIGARRCTVTRGTGTQFASDSSVPWTFGSAVLNTSVKIANT